MKRSKLPASRLPVPDRQRVADRLEQLWAIARGPDGGADRPAFSLAEARAMRMVSEWAATAGLAPGLDRHGNLWALPPNWDGPLVTCGSHVDSVPDGGRFDGALGTVLGLEVAQALALGTASGSRAGVLVCVAEEAPRFGAGTIGSRLLVGSLQPTALAQLSDAHGISAARARSEYLDALDDLPRIEAPVERLRAHAEIHVAQRRQLRELGVVEHVATPRRSQLTLHGEAAHAGEVPMAQRRDALAGAAEIVLAVERAARCEPDATVATVGTLRVDPGAISVIAGRAQLGIDARAIDCQSLERLDAAITAAVADVARRRGLVAEHTVLRGGSPVTLDPDLVREALAAAQARAVAATATWSGAGHDAAHLANLAPTLLLFVPLSGGESHTPQEDADEQDIEHAALVAIDVLGAH